MVSYHMVSEPVQPQPPETTVHVRHHLWSGDLMLGTNGRVRHVDHGSLGDFHIAEDLVLLVKWDEWPVDIFVQIDGNWIARELISPAINLSVPQANLSCEPRLGHREVTAMTSVVENTVQLANPANAEFERHFGKTGTNPFVGWNPPSASIRSYVLCDVVLDGRFRALIDENGAIRATGYMISDEILEAICINTDAPHRICEDSIAILGCNVGHANYFHWITQALPAIDLGVQRWQNAASIAVILPKLNWWQEESLRYLSLPGNVKIVSLGDPNKQHEFSIIEYSDILNGGSAFCTSRIVSRTYARLRSAVLKRPNINSKIYVARTDAPGRRMLNEAMLIERLKQRGFQIVVPGDHSVSDQMRIFREATLVVGPHGAGMTNIVFCEPQTIVYELIPAHYSNACFCNLAHICGLRYWADAFTSEGEGLPNLRDWRSDTDFILERLDEIEAIPGSCLRG